MMNQIYLNKTAYEFEYENRREEKQGVGQGYGAKGWGKVIKKSVEGRARKRSIKDNGEQ